MTNLHSPLSHAQAAFAASHTTAITAGIVMREAKYLGHLNLRGNPSDKAFMDAVTKVLRVALPTQPNTIAESNQARVFWLGPNEWLLLVAADTQGAVAAELRNALVGQHVAITDVSSGQTLVNLSGDHVADVLMKSTVYDCHEHNFPVGKVVQTTFAKTGTTMARLADGSFDLVIRRSFSDYFFLWLADASEEYGLQVQ